MKTINIQIIRKIVGILQKYLSIIIPLLVVVTVARLYEVFLLQPAYDLANSLKINIIGGIYDIWFIARLSVTVFVVFAVVVLVCCVLIDKCRQFVFKFIYL